MRDYIYHLLLQIIAASLEKVTRILAKLEVSIREIKQSLQQLERSYQERFSGGTMEAEKFQTTTD